MTAFYKTPLYLAVMKKNIDIINLLLLKNELDINSKITYKIQVTIILMKFKIQFNEIQYIMIINDILNSF